MTTHVSSTRFRMGNLRRRPPGHPSVSISISPRPKSQPAPKKSQISQEKNSFIYTQIYTHTINPPCCHDYHYFAAAPLTTAGASPDNQTRTLRNNNCTQIVAVVGVGVVAAVGVVGVGAAVVAASLIKTCFV